MARERAQLMWMPIITAFVIITKTGHRMPLSAKDPETSIVAAGSETGTRDKKDAVRDRVVAETISMQIKMVYATIMILLPKSRAFFSKA